jgi:transcription elongation regulator 1
MAPMAPLRMQGYPGFYPPPMAMPNFPPPLPAGWSEHTGASTRLTAKTSSRWTIRADSIVAPDGMTKYYFNTHTKESTYTRPTFVPSFPNFLPPGAGVVATPSPPPQPKKKKEKPKNKVPIPGTSWTRVTTTEGNVFYFEKESKRSEWTVPEEIREAVEALEAEEREQKAKEEEEEEEKRKAERLEKLREQERIRLEVEEERKRKAEKRKAERDAEGGAGMGDGERKAKMAKTDGEGEEEEEEDDGLYGPEDEQDEAEWMKAVAAEFAAADQAEQEENEKTKEATERDEAEAAKKVFAVPEKVNVSLEEGRALFKASVHLLYDAGQC